MLLILLYRRLREIIKACCLEHDLEMLPNGEDTEIGEKGINLSGAYEYGHSIAPYSNSGNVGGQKVISGV